MADDLKDAIKTNATAPKRARADGVEMEQQSLTDQIAVDRYLASKSAASGKSPKLMINRLVPPGAA